MTTYEVVIQNKDGETKSFQKGLEYSEAKRVEVELTNLYAVHKIDCYVSIEVEGEYE